MIAWRIHQVAYVENLKPFAPIELLDRPDQPEIAFLNEVEKIEAAARVSFGDRDDQPEVGTDEGHLGFFALMDEPVQLGPLGGVSGRLTLPAWPGPLRPISMALASETSSSAVRRVWFETRSK